MRRRLLVIAVPLLAAAWGGQQLIGAASTTAVGRGQIHELEKRVQRRLLTINWLPEGAVTGPLPPAVGVRRVLQSFTRKDGHPLCILAQQPRSEDANRYHHSIFVKRAEAKISIGNQTGYFVTGSTGERRLFWEQGDTALILSSPLLGDSEMRRIAESVR